jgi:acetyl-CoA acyltransferase
MRDAVIVTTLRTPVGRGKKGSLRDTRPDDLTGLVIKSAVERTPGLKSEEIDDIIMGCAIPEAEQGMNIARIGALIADIPTSVPAMTVNRFCSSGLQAIAIGAQEIATDNVDIVLAGGVESMSMVPMTGLKPAPNPELAERYPEAYSAMGHTAEEVARRFGVSREEQDAFAVESHARAIAAIEAGRFADECLPVATRVQVAPGEWREVTLERDECPRVGTTREGLAKLRPAFTLGGSVTAGNSSPISDGAACTVVMSADAAAERGLKPLAYFRGFVAAGVDPDIMGIGPIPAVRKILARKGLTLDDIDLIELNEAFAAQSVYVMRELGLDPEKVNVNGGAIALGHPLGCTGAKLTSSLIYELRRRGGGLGLVTMCIGGGMGAAGLFEVVAP